MKRTNKHTPYTAPLGKATARLLAALAASALVGACGGEAQPPPGETLVGIPTEVDVEVGRTEGALLVPLVEDVDFGTIWQGAVREFRFPLVSAGTEPARIQSIKASCGCTLVASYVMEPGGGERVLDRGEPLAPGTRVEVAVRFDSRGRAGREHKEVTVYGDGPDGRVRLEVGVETRPFLLMEPAALAFDRVFPQPGMALETRITSADGEPFELALASEVGPGLDVQLERAGAAWVVRATLAPEVAPGTLIQELVLVSDRPMDQPGPLASIGVPAAVTAHPDGAFHYTVLPVSAVVVGPLETLPPYLPFGFVMPGSLTSQSTRVECFDPALTAAFLAAEPRVRFGPEEGATWPAGMEDAFHATWRAVEPGAVGVRALSKGATAAWDLEVAFTGRRGAGQNRLVGEAIVEFDAPAAANGAAGGDVVQLGSPQALPPQVIKFQVILQP